ncbi:redoxin family protein [Tenacibaculum sp. ZS6-P6]|uniref:redoxin family protein n=1 Tax=Tenacibaculum sp. ZS6-P6 TaxID=3447503 RepID=UPI003F98D3F8
MRKFPGFLFITFIIVIFSCKKEKKNGDVKNDETNFSLEGKIMHNHSNIVYLLDKSFNKIDSTLIRNNSFIFNRNVFKQELFYLNINQISYPFIIDSTRFVAVLDKFEAKIIGGKLNTLLNNYRFKSNQINNLISAYYSKYEFKDISLRTLLKSIDSLQKNKSKETMNFIIKNKNNILSEIVFKESKMSSSEAIQLNHKIINSTNQNLLNSIQKRVKQMKLLELEKSISRRKVAPNFFAVNLRGSKTELKSLLKGRKALLIDFWASWCPPCRAASPEIKFLYEKYYPKGFDVLSVSEDRSVSDWKNGILIDGLESWNHVYDDYNRVSSLYGVNALPHMVLIDQNGKIIKNKISMSELKSELKNIFE